MQGEDGDGPGAEDSNEMRGEGRRGVPGESAGNAHFEVSCVIEEAEVDSREADEGVDVEEEDAVEERDTVRHLG